MEDNPTPSVITEQMNKANNIASHYAYLNKPAIPPVSGLTIFKKKKKNP